MSKHLFGIVLIALITGSAEAATRVPLSADADGLARHGPPARFDTEHSAAVPCGGGSFVLTGTRFAATCLLGDCNSPPGPRERPPVRFWRFANDAAANSGRKDPFGDVPTSCDFSFSWLTNPALDFGVARRGTGRALGALQSEQVGTSDHPGSSSGQAAPCSNCAATRTPRRRGPSAAGTAARDRWAHAGGLPGPDGVRLEPTADERRLPRHRELRVTQACPRPTSPVASHSYLAQRKSHRLSSPLTRIATEA